MISSSHRASHLGAIPRPNSDFEWQNWPEVTVKLYQLPTFVETAHLFQLFAHEGEISKIELYEDKIGRRNGVGSISFCPPPERHFWDERYYMHLHDQDQDETYEIRLALEPKRRDFMHQSPVHRGKFYPQRVTLKADSISFGFLYQEATMMVMKKEESTPMNPVQFVVDLLRKRIEIQFSMHLRDTQRFKIEIPFQQISECLDVNDTNCGVGLVIPLKDPPKVFRRSVDPLSTHERGARYWSERLHWYRQTEIIQDRASIVKAPISLGRQALDIDIGRWKTYRLGFNQSQDDPGLYSLIQQALSDYNIEFRKVHPFHLVSSRDSPLTSWIETNMASNTNASSILKELESGSIRITSFAVRYQLEVCLSLDCINEFNITKEFIRRLADMNHSSALDLLEHVAETNQRYYNPLDIFNIRPPRGTASRKTPEYCYLAYTATVTPSSIYFATPMLETSNRVIRQYRDYKDRFLRVRFADENCHGKINGQESGESDAIFTRVKRTLVNGIIVGDRHFEFLAFGNSQLREHGAYFFSAPMSELNVNSIRAWMGDFRPIRVVAKCASRIGQCFSTTRAINGTKVQIKEIEDVKNGEYIFTDGVGKISKFLAQMVASELKIQTCLNDPPSVFQFRLGGCKGVLALAPEIGPREVHIRPSQYKFAAIHEGLEIIRSSSFAVATLNQQLVTLLSTLGIEDEIFLVKQAKMLHELDEAMTNESKALSHLQHQIDPNQMTLTIASIMQDGFMEAQDPFAISLLHLWKAWTVKYLKEKARIIIEKGAFLLGCTDESRTLRGHWNDSALGLSASFEEHIQELPEIFLKISHPAMRGEYLTVEGICLVGRNPSLHPGDLRVVRAVNNPKLGHLKNVIVFPQQGDRDIPSMCSGGDLDGDDFFVFWDPDLIPQGWRYPPMKHQGQKAQEELQDVTIDQISNHFVNFMKNDKLARIANAWLANADYLERGAESHICKALAELHSVAVDYPKSGVPAVMPRRLIAFKFPHFMESLYRAKEKTYRSTRVLGQLFDHVSLVDFLPLYHLPFDKRILTACIPPKEVLEAARQVKLEYDAAMHRIMAQHQIQTEFEVWSTFVLKHANFMKKYDSHEVMARHRNALREQFQQVCYEKAGGRDFTTLVPFIVAMYTVTAHEVAEAVGAFRQQHKDDKDALPGLAKMTSKERPLISFPWLFHKELGKIANGFEHPTKSNITAHPAIIEPKVASATQTSVMDIDLMDLHAGHDDVETAHGVTHRGELLELFQGGGKDEVMSNEDERVAPAATHLNNGMASDIAVVSKSDVRDDVNMMDMNSGESTLVPTPESDGEFEDGEIIELDVDNEPSALEKLARLLQSD